MKISFLGDSITQGCGASEFGKGYVELFGAKYGVQAKNYGLGGTRIARQKEKSEYPQYDLDFIGRVKDIDKSSDFVFVFGGTNDYEHGRAEFGTFADYGEYTFCGAVNLLSDMLTGEFGKDKICFILPCRRVKGELPNMHGKNLEDYVKAITRIVGGKGIDTLDLFYQGFPKPQSDKGDEFTADGLHPNDNGHAYIAGRIADYLKNKGVL